MRITFKVNGQKARLDVPPMKRLLDTLREDLGLYGAKEGCGEGECGACSVLLDGEVVTSCLVATCQVEDREVVTIEGLAGKKLHALQTAFLEHGAAQCGICTPGMILAAAALPSRPSLEEVRVGLAGNLCRCTGYTRIYAAVQDALGRPTERRQSAVQSGGVVTGEGETPGALTDEEADATEAVEPERVETEAERIEREAAKAARKAEKAVRKAEKARQEAAKAEARALRMAREADEVARKLVGEGEP